MILRSSLRRASLLALLVALVLPGIARAQDPAKAQDIVFGFFDKELPDGKKHNLAVELQEEVGGLDYWEWDALGDEFPKVSDGWEERRVLDALDLMAKTGHRAKFNLTGFDFAGDDNPLKLGRTDGIDGSGYTAWELTQIRYHRAYWNQTDFYLRGKDGKYRKLTPKELEKLGLRYEAPALEELDARKGRKLRSSPDEDVFAVRGDPTKELVLPRAPDSEDKEARANRIDALAVEKDALDALAKHYVPVARRYELGTLRGEVAYVRDRLSKEPPTEGSANEDTKLTFARDLSGEVLVSSVGSARPIQRSASDAVAQDVKRAITLEALHQSTGADDPKIAPYLTIEAVPGTRDSPSAAKKFVRSLLDYVEKDETGWELVRLVREGKLELATDGEEAKNKVIVPIGRDVPFAGYAAKFVQDAVAALRKTEDATYALRAEALAHGYAFAERMRLPLKFIRDKMWLRPDVDIMKAVLESSGAESNLSGRELSKVGDRVQAIVAPGPEGGIDPALLKRIQARDRAVAASGGARTGMSELLDERLKPGSERDAGER
jgi:hypothetical protein